MRTAFASLCGLSFSALLAAAPEDLGTGGSLVADAVQAGDTAKVRDLLQSGTDVNAAQGRHPPASARIRLSLSRAGTGMGRW
jgi:hypothetical protein